MKSPKLVPSAHEAIYEYYGAFEPNQRIQRLGFWLMHALYRSQVHYRNGADEMIRAHLLEGGSIIAAPNHQSNADTPTIGGLIFEPTFAPVRGKITAPGKVGLYKTPGVGWFMKHMGTHPAFRSKEFKKHDTPKPLRDAVTDNLIGFNTRFINNGGSIAIFTEATRNQDDPREIQSLRPGVARIIEGVEDPGRVLAVPMGFAYRFDFAKLRPLVVVNEPFRPVGMGQEEILATLHDGIQSATTQAFNHVEGIKAA